MSFRRRMVLLAAGAVATAVVLSSVVVYVVTRDELIEQTDTSLRQKLIPGQPQSVQIRTQKLSPALAAKLGPRLAKLKREGRPLTQTFTYVVGGATGGNVHEESVTVVGGTHVARSGFGAGSQSGSSASAGSQSGSSASISAPEAGSPGIARVVLPAPKLGVAAGYAQLYRSNGDVLSSERAGSVLPVTTATRAVASGRRPPFFSDATISGTRVRVLTERAPEGGVWQVALSLSDVESTLSHLKLVLAIVCLGGIALAALLGLLVSRAALVPVRRLTGAAERVARTQDLGHRIQAREQDELGRLAASFNTMLAALERSRLSQRQLISDASHELRTPLTSVQANLDALALGDELTPVERARAIASTQAQLRELTVLVGDMVDLSKTEVEDVEVEDVRLDLAVADALGRARLHAPDCKFSLDAEPCIVRASPSRLDRAIANLLDNASKWNPPTPPLNPPIAPGNPPVAPGSPPSQPCCPSSPPAGPVEVRVRDGCLEVRDHGPGFAAEDLPRVFDRFFRAPAARGRPGSGLGLAIVRQMAETHGGSVQAANDPGGGAQLTLELPTLAMSAAESAASEADAVV
jgi:two-component system sensor histidine kinase MprB